MKPQGLFLIILINYFHGTFVTGENILVVMPVCFPSHFRSFKPFLEELIRRGHNLTMLSKFHLADDVQTKYNQVDVPFDYCHMQNSSEIIKFMAKSSGFTNTIVFSDYYSDYMDKIFELPQVQHLIQSDDQYDLVIAELFFMDIFFAFGYKFDAPTIALCPFNSIQFFYSWTLGNPYPSSYVPNQLSSYSENMSLLQRISNLIFNYWSVAYYEFFFLPRTRSLLENNFHFDKTEIPDIKAIMRNISLVLVNSHYSFGSIKPELPNIINVAGLHFPPSKPLPKNIQKFMDEAENGVIYVSMGSAIQPSDVEYLGKINPYGQDFLKSVPTVAKVWLNCSPLGRFWFVQELIHFPQRIVMKWDPQLLTEVPDNILVEKWIPQTDILNHPNCKLFISHGGLHSTLESINASVPLLGIPIISDQHYNMAAIENYGAGKMIPLEEVSRRLSADVKEILHNPKYKINMKKRSLLFQERLSSPLETAIFWTEHVIKHKDTSHLQSAAIKLPWYQLYSLDVLGILGIIIFLIVYTLKYIIVRIKGGIQPKTNVKEMRKKED